MLENKLIDETLLFLIITDRSHGELGRQGNPTLTTRVDMDDRYHGPMCQVFSRVLHYDFWDQTNRIGFVEANREIIRIAEMYQPKYVFWSTHTSLHVTEDTLLALRQMGCIVVGRFYDDDDKFDSFSKWIAPSLDYCITNVEKRVPQYEELGTRGIFLPYDGHNEAIHRKLPHLPKQFDVTFIGNIYPDRRERLASLAQMGVSVQIFDSSRAKDKLTLREMIGVINQSRINLNLSLDNAGLGIRQLKGRVFEVTLCGGFLLTEYAPGTEQFFDIGREMVSFDSISEAADKIRYYLEHQEEREEIAAHGYERSLRDYTARGMFQRIFFHIEEDLRKRGRPVPGERSSEMNPMRRREAESCYNWAEFVLNTPAPLRETWRETVELALFYDPDHEGAKRMLRTYERWGDPQGLLVRISNGMRSAWGRTGEWIYTCVRRIRVARWLYRQAHRAGLAP